METSINPSFVKQYAKGQTIYRQGEEVKQIALILKGKVLMTNKTFQYQYVSGGFIGIEEEKGEKYQATFTATEDVVLYEFLIGEHDPIDMVLAIPDYRGLFVSSISKDLRYYHTVYTRAEADLEKLFGYIEKTLQEYDVFCKKYGYEKKPSEIQDRIKEVKQTFTRDGEMVYAYLPIAELSMDIVKTYYNEAGVLAKYQIQEILSMIVELKKQLPKMISTIEVCVKTLMNETDDCLYRKIALLSLQVEESGGANDELMQHLDDITDLLYQEELFFKQYLVVELNIDRKSMGELYSILLTCLKNQDKSLIKKIYELTKDHDEILKDTTGLFEQITDYVDYEKTKKSELKKALVKYINLRDKNSVDDETREIRSTISKHFYELYESVFIKAYESGNVSRPVEMFLDYALLDERLITKEQIIYLYNCKDNYASDIVPIYTIRTWLTLVYENQKEPSKNEFDLDYREVIASMHKERKLSKEEADEALHNGKMKLHFEIQNIFRYNHRIIYGQASSFVPMITKESLYQDIRRVTVTAKRIEDVINELVGIDFSVFNQEVLYSDPEAGIVKEYVIKQVIPDIILFPTYGVNGCMWQETSSKKRDTPARFLLPMFTDRELMDILVKLCGRFRWEICRRLQGGTWNNIQYKSLTSEYMDYIQFYKKNRELTEDKKESLKSQLSKSRNNVREVFVLDYETWIRNESKGGIRLNKIVREIMATYCPFTKQIRETLGKQPIYQDAMNRYSRQNVKKLREIESHMIALEKSKVVIPKELTDTLAYYKEN